MSTQSIRDVVVEGSEEFGQWKRLLGISVSDAWAARGEYQWEAGMLRGGREWDGWVY
jgi:hypothetical protein